MKPVSLPAYGLRNIAVLRQGLKIFGPNPRQYVHYGGYGASGISREVVNDRV